MKHLMEMFLLVVGALLTAQIVKLASWPYRVAFVLACLLGLIYLPGCAMLPMPMPPNDMSMNSNAAEGTWLALDAVDTLQTMHLKKGTACAYEADPLARALYGGANPAPARVLVTNLALMTAHTMITSWLDDEVAKHYKADDDQVGLWYAGRLAWHAVSIGASGASVVNNYYHGCKL